MMATVLKSRLIQHGDNTASVEVFNWEDVAAKAKAYLAEVRSQAAAILEQAKSESEKLCREAEQQGRTSGMNEVQQQAEKLATKLTTERVGKATQSIHSLADELEQATQQWLRQWQHETVPLAVAIAERLVHRQIDVDPTILLDWLQESVRMIQSDVKLELRIHPEDVRSLGESLSDFIAQQQGRNTIMLVEDASIERHGMVLRTSETTIDQRLSKQLERLREELQ
jgi:flagellar assembly protein FliH